jgi:hypothetical protein
MTTCISCRREVEQGEERFQQVWCVDCLPRIEFEERRARAIGMAVLSVTKTQFGNLEVKYKRLDHGEPTQEDLAALRPDHEDVVADLIAALVEFQRSVQLDEFDRIISLRESAPIAARSLLDTAARMRPLLDDELFQGMAGWLRVAQLVDAQASTRLLKQTIH